LQWVKYKFGKKYASLTGWWINTSMDISWASTGSPVHQKSLFISILWKLQMFVYVVVTKEFTMIFKPGMHLVYRNYFTKTLRVCVPIYLPTLICPTMIATPM